MTDAPTVGRRDVAPGPKIDIGDYAVDWRQAAMPIEVKPRSVQAGVPWAYTRNQPVGYGKPFLLRDWLTVRLPASIAITGRFPAGVRASGKTKAQTEAPLPTAQNLDFSSIGLPLTRADTSHAG